jgi:zinc transporter
MAAPVRGLHESVAVGDEDAAPGGVICAFEFSDGVGVAIESPDLGPPPRGIDWAWSHLRLADVRARALLQRVATLPPKALHLFLSHEDRVQIEQAGAWAFGVLPDYERDLGGRPQEDGRLCIACDERRLITGRLHALSAVDDLRRAVLAGERLETPGKALVRLIELYVTRTEAILDDQGGELARIEDYVLTAPPSPRESSLTPIRRRLARYRRDLWALRSALSRASAGRHGRRIEPIDNDVGEIVAWLEDVDHEVAALQERAQLIHEEIDTLINAATNRAMRTLTIISTLLIPPTLIVGAFGMNVPGIPWDHSPVGFWTASAFCAVVVLAAFWLLRRWGLLS